MKEFDAQLRQLTWTLIRQFPPKHKQQPLSFKSIEWNKIRERKTRDGYPVELLFCYPVELPFLFELHYKTYTLLKHCSLLACVIVCNACETTWSCRPHLIIAMFTHAQTFDRCVLVTSFHSKVIIRHVKKFFSLYADISVSFLILRLLYLFPLHFLQGIPSDVYKEVYAMQKWVTNCLTFCSLFHLSLRRW